METALSIIAILVAVGSLTISILSWRATTKGHRRSFRPELRRIRSRWRSEIVPSLGAHGGVLSRDEDIAFCELKAEAKVVSEDVYGALGRAYSIIADLTAIHEVVKNQWPPPGDAVNKQKVKFAKLREIMAEVDDKLERDLKAHL